MTTTTAFTPTIDDGLEVAPAPLDQISRRLKLPDQRRVVASIRIRAAGRGQ